MGMKRKQVLMRQKERFERELKSRRELLSGKGIEPRKADRDTLVRKYQADIKAVQSRLRLIEDNEKRIEETARIKAERAAAPRKEKESGKSEKPEKPKKGQEGGKEKKAKPEKKAAAPKASEEGPGQTPSGPPEEDKAPAKE